MTEPVQTGGRAELTYSLVPVKMLSPDESLVTDIALALISKECLPRPSKGRCPCFMMP